MTRDRRLIERGATAVESAIVAAAVAIALISAMEYLQDRTGESIEDSGTRIGTPAEHSQDPVTTTTGP